MFKQFSHRLWPVVTLLLIVFSIFLTNYQPSTWLTGWDNLHPEFDFKTNIIDRSIYGVWQQYQGVGILSGNAHSADLIRQILLWITSIIIPTSLIRYFYHFSALFVGSIGIYFFTKSLLPNQMTAKIASFFAALIYIFNLGTIQYFYVPYESFSHFYASLPWLIIIANKLFSKWSAKSVGIFILINLLSTPSFYIPTIFMVYLLILLILTFSQIAKSFSTKSSNDLTNTLRTTFQIFALTMLVNAFWLLPFVYFVSQGTTDYTSAKINLMFTDEAFLRNQLFGNIPNVLLFKSYLFDTTDFSKDMQTHQYMMQTWSDHLNHFGIRELIYGLFGISLSGTIYGIYKKINLTRTLLVIELISLIALINNNPPTGFIYSFLQNHFTLTKQLFRFPFTKFIVPILLTYSIFFGLGIHQILNLLSKIKRHLSALFISLLAALIFITYLPIFQGNFIYSAMRIQIPNEYFSLMKYLNAQPNAKIAYLPQPTFWGWTSYKWGYRGSGFPWYGIKQPILDRAFDVWSPYNEQYYQELNTILVSEDYAHLDTLLEKYHIYYLWIDDSIIIPENRDLLQPTKLRQFLQSDANYQLVFSEGNQHIYTYTPITPTDIQVTNSPQILSTAIFQNPSKSLVQSNIAHQIIFRTKSPTSGILYVPSVGEQESSAYASISVQGNLLSISMVEPQINIDGATLPTPPTQLTLSIPNNNPQTIIINDQTIDHPNQTITIKPKNILKILDNTTNTPIYQTNFTINISSPTNQYPIQANQLITISYPPLNQSTIEILPWIYNKPAVNCFELGTGSFSRTVDSLNHYVEYSAFRASSCDYFEISTPTDLSGLMTQISSQNISGRPPKLSFHQNPPGNYLSEDLLPPNNSLKDDLFVTPYTNLDNSKLYLEIDNYAVGNEIKTNRLGSIRVSPFAMKHLQSITINQPNHADVQVSYSPTLISNPYQYIFDLHSSKDNQLISLSQAQNTGWQLYLLTTKSNLLQRKFPFLFTSPLPKASANWNNQWEISSNDLQSDYTAVVIFWPQYIAMIGFVITGILTLYIGINIYKPRRD